jgi:phosphatidylserine/phosphatidylglycerophosphate/cardiolipin synthase-like enzyme
VDGRIGVQVSARSISAGKIRTDERTAHHPGCSMRFKSDKRDGFQVFAVTGINTVSFAITATATARRKLLGFAVERADPEENERYFMPGFKVFKAVIPHPDENTKVSTFDHPVQSFVWDDFTGKSGRTYDYFFYPIRGEARNLDHSAAPIPIQVQTEPLYSRLEHDVFFNRGVASSQAYAREFDNKRPDQLSPAEGRRALRWLSRELDDAMLKFIRQAGANDGLLGCFYEFRYRPVADAIKEAIARGADVKLIIDGKVNEHTDSKGKFHASFPREENLAMLRDAGIPLSRVILRQAKPNDIQHNKFMVLLKGAARKPTEVWTGSTNVSNGGIHGQTNVGHWVRQEGAAQKFQAYWSLLSQDPGAAASDDQATARRKNADLRDAVEALQAAPANVAAIPPGITPVFSPRPGLKVLDLYVSLVDGAQVSSAITLAFGVNKTFKDQLKDNTSQSHIVFLLLEKKDEPTARNRDTFVRINAANNVYMAWGAFIKDPLYQWTKETNARLLQFNQHVSYVHSKFLLMDPLSDDPIVVSGSANFSNASTNANDENMLIIRGDQRVADIYFTEFNRLFNHYYFRAVTEAITEAGRPLTDDSLFLKEKAEEWLVKYQPGKLRQKRVDLFARMKGFA